VIREVVQFDCTICKRPAPISEAVIEVDSGNVAVWDWLERTNQIGSGGGLQWAEDLVPAVLKHAQDALEAREAGRETLGIPTFDREPDWPVVEWEWNHRACADAADEGRGYSFDASRMSNSAEALGWTLHLEQKNWMAATNWKEFVEDLGFSSDG